MSNRPPSVRAEHHVQIKNIPISEIKPYENNPRINDPAVETVAKSIKEFGWQQPIVVDEDGVILAGHTRYKAAKKLKRKTIPVIVAEGLTDEQRRAYRIADNRSADFSRWDFPILIEEIEALGKEWHEFLSIDDFGSLIEQMDNALEVSPDMGALIDSTQNTLSVVFSNEADMKHGMKLIADIKGVVDVRVKY
jgi:site-specific DNA-methyltransferase (adenine-specific)